MDKSAIKLRTEYGYRQNPRSRDPLERVRVLERVRTKWKVQWVYPNPGLVDYIDSKTIVVRWAEHKAFLRDEERLAALHKRILDNWPGGDSPVVEAVQLVLDSTGEGIWLDNYGVMRAKADTIERVCDRAHFELPHDRASYVDRHRMQHVPFEIALALAQAFAAAEPQTVLIDVDVAERQYEIKAREPGNAFYVPRLQQYRAHWALCRRWAGFDEALRQRDAEIKRLRELVEEQIWKLRGSGRAMEADKLERKLHGD